VDIAPPLFAAEAQVELRQRLGIRLPLDFWDGDTKVFVVILPEDAISFTREDGALCYEAAASTGSSQPPVAKPNPAKVPANVPAGKQDGGKCVGDWKRCQDEFKHLGKLPKPWIFIRSSRDKEVIYYLNTETQATAVERPLPAGWTKHSSKTTGKTYYFHAKRNASTFEIPPPE